MYFIEGFGSFCLQNGRQHLKYEVNIESLEKYESSQTKEKVTFHRNQQNSRT